MVSRMSRQTNATEADRVDRAFNRVLAAEAEARERVETCKQEAANIVSDAGRRARAISDATDRRMGLVRRIADRGVGQAVARLLGEPGAGDGDDSALSDTARLDRVVEALVVEILGSATPAG